MSLINKIKNFFTGKGWKLDDEIEREKLIDEQIQQEKKEETEKEFDIIPPPEPPQEKEEETATEPSEKLIPIKTKEQKIREIDRAIKVYESKKKVSEIEKGIKPEIVNNVELIRGQQGDLNNLKPQYSKLFVDNAKINDPDILNVLYEGRGQLQHRFTAIITVFIDGKEASRYEYIGVLIEQTNIIYNFINEGMKIDSPPQLDQMLAEAGDQMKQIHSIIDHNPLKRNTFKGTITNINVNVTFA